MPSVSDDRNRKPPRPMIPSALWALVVVCVVERAVMAGGFASGDAVTATVVASGALLLVTGLVVLVLSRMGGDATRAVGGAVAAVGLVGAVSAGLCCARQLRCMQALGGRAVSSWELTVGSETTPGTYGYRCRARVRAEGKPEGLVWLTLPRKLPRGTRLTAVGRYARPTTDEYGQSSWMQGICGSVRVVRILSWREPTDPLSVLHAHVLETLGPSLSDTRALLAGCVCGAREHLRTCGLDKLFATCGLAHLIAVSGSHLSLVCALLALAIAPLELGPPSRLLLLGCLSGAFVLFCGAPVSAVRAWIMSLVGFGSQLVGRRTHALSSVSVVALSMALLDPAVAGELAFALSAISVIGLCLLMPYATYVLRVMMPLGRFRRWVPAFVCRRMAGVLDAGRQALAAAMVCQLVTMPLTARVFGRISVVGPVANVVAAPVLTLLQACGLLAAVFCWLPPVAAIPLAVADLVGEPLIRMLQTVARLPCASVSVAAVGPWLVPLGLLVIGLVLAAWPTVTRRVLLQGVGIAAVLLAATVIRWRFLAPARVVVLDVGQGDAILVQDGPSALLVDAGPGEAIQEALARQHVLHLDAVVVTHQHDDHYGGVASLVGSVSCSRLYCADGVADELTPDFAEACARLTGGRPEELAYGDTLRVGGFELRMIWPREAVTGTVNAESLMQVLSYRRDGRALTALLTGDAERDEVSACVDRGDVGDIDLLKVGHHGSDVSIYAQDARTLAPEVAAASAGEGNAYGHPRPECVRTLEDVGTLFLCTKDVGDIEVRPGREGPVVRVERRSHGGL